MARDADYWINQLNLTKHIEGGSFRETYRSSLNVSPEVIGLQFDGPRSISTSIYFLLEEGQFSAFHKIKSDETWHFYDGDALDIFEIEKDGLLVIHKLGREPEKGQSFQLVIKAGNWFGARVAGNGSFSLVGCTVAPGFDFSDFQLANRADLLRLYPQHKSIIGEMTY